MKERNKRTEISWVTWTHLKIQAISFKYLYVQAASQTNHIRIFQSWIQASGLFKAHQVIPMLSKSWELFGGFSIYLCELCSPWRQWISFLKDGPMILISRKTFVSCDLPALVHNLSVFNNEVLSFWWRPVILRSLSDSEYTLWIGGTSLWVNVLYYPWRLFSEVLEFFPWTVKPSPL